jgi:hypothetical protein
MFYESDGDPDGVADVIGIHYPHEYPEYTCWPNEAYWLAKPQKSAGHHFTNGATEFFWRKDKPLYIGEFLWLPSSEPSWHTVFFGDDAYLDYRRYRNLGKAESWKMQILGYRHHEVGGISPWTVIEGGPLTEENSLYQAHQFAYQKIAAYCHNYDSRFFSGEEVTRRVEVYNDVLERSTLKLEWTLSDVNNVVDHGEETLRLEPGDHRMLTISLRMPEATGRVPLCWQIAIRRNGIQVFDHTYRYAVIPPIKAPAVTARVGLFDPQGTTAAALRRLGVAARRVSSLTATPADVDVLVIGAGAFGHTSDTRRSTPSSVNEMAIGEVPPEWRSLTEFVEDGGRIMVLRQDGYPPGWFDVAPSNHESTMTFPLCSHHPALRAIEPDDLKFWRGDHLVAANEIVRPPKGGFTSIVVSGSREGINHAPLLERRIGRGSIIHCQLKLIEKAGKEPTADRLLVNLVEYLSENKAREAAASRFKTALIGGSKRYHQLLRSLGLRYDDLTERLASVDLSSYALIVCRGDLSHIDKLQAFVDQGGNLLVHRADQKGVEALRRSFDLDLDLQPYAGSVARAEGDHPLLNHIGREDLYWLGEHTGISWSTTPRASEMAEGVFGKRIDGKPGREFQIETWQLEGQIVERRDPGVAFATIGSATADIDFPAIGTYVIGIVGRGTPCDGGWPMARISVDDSPVGTVTVPSDRWQTYTVLGNVEQGRHNVAVAFVNDKSNPEEREDRNLYVDKVLVAFDEHPDAAFLTNPPAVAHIRRGAGQLVIDQLRWDVETRNARKAARYAGSLLTALGGDFTPRFGVTVECENLKPQAGMQHFRVADGIVSQATNGRIRAPIRIAAAGRYSVELLAKGTPLDGVFPLIDVYIGERKLGQVQIASEFWWSYPLSVELPDGTHEFTLEFVNDANRPGEADRNVMYDKLVFYRDGPRPE